MNYTMLRGDENKAKVEQCPGFETFGADVKTAREKLGISRRELAEKIGVNANQIARRVNSTGSVYQEDIDNIKKGGVLNEIWRLQRLNLSKAP